MTLVGLCRRCGYRYPLHEERTLRCPSRDLHGYREDSCFTAYTFGARLSLWLRSAFAPPRWVWMLTCGIAAVALVMVARSARRSEPRPPAAGLTSQPHLSFAALASLPNAAPSSSLTAGPIRTDAWTFHPTVTGAARADCAFSLRSSTVPGMASWRAVTLDARGRARFRDSGTSPLLASGDVVELRVVAPDGRAAVATVRVTPAGGL